MNVQKCLSVIFLVFLAAVIVLIGVIFIFNIAGQAELDLIIFGILFCLALPLLIRKSLKGDDF